MPMEQIAFYVKGRPQGADIISLILDHNRVFIGYPPFRKGVPWSRHAVASCLLDISVPDDQWRTDAIRDDITAWKRQISGNRNLATRIEAGSMVLVPRPHEGRCYIGRVKARFQLVNDPAWAQEYLNLRRELDAGIVRDTAYEESHIGDVVQSWEVERWESAPFPMLPRWIQYQVMGQRTTGQIHDRYDGKKRALDVLSDLYARQWTPTLPPALDKGEVVGRLLDWVGPAGLEHLVCDLLQRDQAPNRWWHTGGSGDGGADGIGVDTHGNVVGVLQCKWQLNEDPYALADRILPGLQRAWGAGAKVYVASLFPRRWPRASPRTDTILLGPNEIAELLVKHRQDCSLSASLNIR